MYVRCVVMVAVACCWAHLYFVREALQHVWLQRRKEGHATQCGDLLNHVGLETVGEQASVRGGGRDDELRRALRLSGRRARLTARQGFRAEGGTCAHTADRELPSGLVA